MDESSTKFISLVVTLAVLSIAHFLENCVTAKENHVAWHELDEYKNKINSQTGSRMFPYIRESLKIPLP